MLLLLDLQSDLIKHTLFQRIDYNMKNIFSVLLIAISIPLFAETKTFIREYTYTASEADSKITSRAIALDQVKRMLLEEIGIYLKSEFQTAKQEKNGVYSELTKEQTQSITAGITETKILEERWNGETYYIKASITVDPDEVTKTIARIAADQNKLKELEEVEHKADEAISEIAQLRKEFDSTKSENEKLAKQKEYIVASDNLSASDWFQKGYNAAELKEYDNAILYYQKSIDLNPNNASPYINLGLAYHDKGNLDKAIQVLQKAIDLNPQNSMAFNNLGAAYAAKGNLDKAIELYEKAVEINPEYSAAYNNMGSAYIQKGNFDKAIQLFQKAIDLNPQNFQAYVGLGMAYEANGNDDKAIELLQKAIEFNPNSFDAYLGLGTAYSYKDNPNKAIELLQKAIDLKPQVSTAYYILGGVYQDEGNLDKAIQLYKKAAQLGDKGAQQWLKTNGYTW
jgi:tetratricopeptide (TPR) repeat protein